MRSSAPASWPARLARGRFSGRAFADCLVQAGRMGWTPSHPAFNRNPLDIADEAGRRPASRSPSTWSTS